MAVGELESAAQDTRERILHAAEQLFALNGYASTSVREITARAACNVAAVNYHFGSKEGLYRAVFQGLLGELRDLRIRHIRTALEEAGDEATLETFLEAFAVSFLEPLLGSDRGRYLMAFMDHELRHSHLAPDVLFTELIQPLFDVSRAALESTGPRLSRQQAGLCLMSLVGQLIHVIKVRERIAADTADLLPADIADHVRHVVRFSAAGFRAVAEEDEPPGRRSRRGPGRGAEPR